MRRRICLSRSWKRAQGPRPASAPGVFAGTLELVALTLQGPRGALAVGEADLAVALAYLARAAPSIAAYASQYGATRLAVGPTTLPYEASFPKGQYSDADLQGWVREIAARASVPKDAALLFLNPPGALNTDAKESGGVGVLGYHGFASVPYAFVNVLGAGFSVADPADLFAEALSHEVAELTVDPRADNSMPEVCDGCGTNCQGASAFRIYFGSGGGYLGGSERFPPAFPYDHFISAIATPAAAADCPAARGACVYPPPA